MPVPRTRVDEGDADRTAAGRRANAIEQQRHAGYLPRVSTIQRSVSEKSV